MDFYLPPRQWIHNPLPPRADQNFMQLIQRLSALLRGRYNSLNSFALPEAPAVPWRPWFMGSRQNILAGSNSHIWTPTMHAPVTFNVRSAFTINQKFTCSTLMGTSCKNGWAIRQKMNLNQCLRSIYSKYSIDDLCNNVSAVKVIAETFQRCLQTFTFIRS